MSAASPMSRRLLSSLVLALVLVLPLLGGCGKSRNVVQLLPDPDGHVGHVTVTNKMGGAELTRAGCAVRVPDAKSAPTPPEDLSPEESESLFGLARRALPPQPARFLLYFESESVKLTRDSLQLLPDVAATAKARDSRDISVVGHTDRAGSPEYNMELSRRRAASVRALLIKAGLPAEYMELTSHGAANPLVESTTPHEPKNRRVEVTVR